MLQVGANQCVLWSDCESQRKQTEALLYGR